MNVSTRCKSIRVALRRKREKRREKKRQWHGNGHPHYDLGIP